ncbi:hypothetical protein HaLaN_20620, partial [Haematococcus lacustris]
MSPHHSHCQPAAEPAAALTSAAAPEPAGPAEPAAVGGPVGGGAQTTTGDDQLDAVAAQQAAGWQEPQLAAPQGYQAAGQPGVQHTGQPCHKLHDQQDAEQQSDPHASQELLIGGDRLAQQHREQQLRQ